MGYAWHCRLRQDWKGDVKLRRGVSSPSSIRGLHFTWCVSAIPQFTTCPCTVPLNPWQPPMLRVRVRVFLNILVSLCGKKQVDVDLQNGHHCTSPPLRLEGFGGAQTIGVRCWARKSGRCATWQHSGGSQLPGSHAPQQAVSSSAPAQLQQGPRHQAACSRPLPD